jgi:hypothetical protein
MAADADYCPAAADLADAPVPAEGSAPDWRAILTREVQLNPRGKAGVAELLNISRPYLARALSNGKSAYRVEPVTLARAVIERFGQIVCPASNEARVRDLCVAALAPAPTHNPSRMQVWRVCQACQWKPKKESPCL